MAKPEVFSVLKTLSIQLVQIVAQSLVTHMKNTLILEELKWFNLVNGSGNLPSLLQVTCLSTETHWIPCSAGCEEKAHEAQKGTIIQRDKSCGSSGPPQANGSCKK